MTFEEEVRATLEAHRGKPFEVLERAIAELHRQHGREVPSPITGWIEVTELPDTYTG